MTSNKAGQRRGVFVSFEGGEGAGKTTHIRFLAETLEARGFEVVRLREPGGTAIGDKLRSIVLDPGNAAMCDACELLVYEAARAQIVEEVIKPALDRGAVVLSSVLFLRFHDGVSGVRSWARCRFREARQPICVPGHCSRQDHSARSAFDERRFGSRDEKRWR